MEEEYRFTDTSGNEIKPEKTYQSRTVNDLNKKQQRRVKRGSYKETTAQMMARVAAGGKNNRRYFKTTESDGIIKAPCALPLNLLIKTKEAKLAKKSEPGFLVTEKDKGTQPAEILDPKTRPSVSDVPLDK